MKNFTRSLTVLFILLSFFILIPKANAQCGIKLIGPSSGCAPFYVTLIRTESSRKTTSSVTWDYTAGKYSSTDSIVLLNFKSPGTDTISITVTYSDGTKCTSTLSKPIAVYGPPKAKIILPSQTTQCLKINSYGFTQSSASGSSGAALVSYSWNFGDGDTSKYYSPTHVYDASGTYNISLRVFDVNGCAGYDTVLGQIVVLKDIKSSFTSNKTTGCNRDSINFYSNADTLGVHLAKYYWNFGDGSPIDSTIFSPSHIFNPGTYHISYTLVNTLGCTSSDTQTITITRFRIRIARKDTVCWSTASRYGVSFAAEQQTGSVFLQWNFGDQNSGQSDIANYLWVANHKFVGGPGNYVVNFTVSSASCGTLDTCFVEHILGPQAIIDLSQINTSPPFPLNNFYPASPMPKSVFTEINNNKSSCGSQSVAYSTFTKIINKRHVKYQYCNASVLSETADTVKDCYGGNKMPVITSVNLKPTDSTVSVFTDSTEVKNTWFKGDAIPSGTVYYPSTGTLTWNAMHDSNLTTCKLPNLVRFTNNSIKHRLYSAIDDNTFLNILDPEHSFQDTCKWKNYPMASDSLTYYWSFNDPSGTNCVSTPSNKNWNCNFSTIAAPYHYYRGINDPPPTGYQVAGLKVTDPVTGCSDSTTISLKQGAPKASWDKAAYCKMTWEMQESQLTPKGAPGPYGPPLIGFMLDQQANACSGPNYRFNIDFSQTIPTSGGATLVDCF